MTLTDNDEKANIDELRRRMKGLMTQEMYEDDSLFRRFLRARNNNIDAAETMLTNNVNWRKINNIDSILSTYKGSEVCEKYVPYNSIGCMKDGTPLIYFHFGTFDTRGILKSVSKNEIINYVVFMLEKEVKSMKERYEKLEKSSDQWIYIFNFENLPLSVSTHKLTVETIISFFLTYDSNYPERLKAAYLINASFIFTVGWTLIKPFMAGGTIDKIQIYGKDGWQEEFKKHLDPAVIPGFLGGQLTDPDGDPTCKSLISFGGPIPETYYSRKCANSMTILPGTKKLTVNRLSKAEVKLEVMYPGSRIDWEVEVKCKDVAFSLLYRTNNSNPKPESQVLIPKRRFETSLSTEVGIYTCENAGIYILEFDNTYSWMYSKEIYYKTSIIRPQSNKSLIKQ